MLDQQIKEVESDKHLGGILSNDCSWQKHIDYIKEKAWTRINIMCLQLEAARISTGAPKLVSVANLYIETGWETLGARRNKHKLMLFYKMLNDLTPPYLSSLVPPLVQSASRYNLRKFQ